MPSNNSTAGAARAAGRRGGAHPYVQVALTYVRRPFSSWPARLASVLFVCVFILDLFCRSR